MGESSHYLISHVPFAKELQMTIIKGEKGRIEALLPYQDRLVGNPLTGVLHGGAVTAFLDNICGAAVVSALDEPTPIATLDLRIDYMRPAEARADIRAITECYKKTRQIAFVRGVAFTTDPDDPVAHCTGTFMLGANRAKPVQSPYSDVLESARQEHSE